jgi:DNA adenine methylase
MHSSGQVDLFPQNKFPVTRFMGSKRKLLKFIETNLAGLKYDSVLDAFSGSCCVSYLFKSLGKSVMANDILSFSYHTANAVIANNNIRINNNDLNFLLKKNLNAQDFIQKTFNGLFFTPPDNEFLDNVSANIALFKNEFKKSLATAAVCKAALKKQPRGVFTVIGQRYNDGRKDLIMSMEEHFIKAINEYNNSVFDNGKNNSSFNKNVFDLNQTDIDLVYLDPPYYSLRSDNDYLRRYHFIEGLSVYWKNLKIRTDSRTKRIEKISTPFGNKNESYKAFNNLFKKFQNSKIALSYSSNSIPTKDELISTLKKYKKHVEVFENNHKYSFGNQNSRINNNYNNVKEYLFVGY